MRFEQAFEESAESAFGFLVRDYGFVLAQLRATDGPPLYSLFGRATYKAITDDRTVALSVAPLRLELDLDIGNGRVSYSLTELHELCGAGDFPVGTHNIYDARFDATQLRAEFERLASVLRNCGGRFFQNDGSLWSELEGQRRRSYDANHEKAAMREAADAFKAEEWMRVIGILEPMEERLEELNRARLHYARGKLK